MKDNEEAEMSWLDRQSVALGEWWRKRHPPAVATIDRRWVRDQYQQVIWPVLEKHGFDTFHDRGAWRHREKRVEVIWLNFQPRFEALKWRVTPFSFWVEAGVFFPFIPTVSPLEIKEKGGELLPREVDCHIRHAPIMPQLKQREKNKLGGLWYVAPDGNNLGDVLDDVRTQLTEQALLWFGRLDDLRYVSKLLTRTQRTAFRGDLELNAWGISSYTPGFLALELGQWQSAAESLQKALDSGAYSAAKFAAFSPSGGDPRYRDEEERYRAKRLKGVASLEEQIRTGLSRAQSELVKQSR